MNAKSNLLAGGMLLAALTNGLSQIIITTQPVSQTNVVGSVVTLTVGATGTPPLLYQWRRGAGNLVGATNDTLVFTNLQTSDAGNYSVIVSNIEGSVTSSVAFLRVIVPPAITGQPTNFPTLSLGASVGNRVTASGTAPLLYQWRLNGTNLPGQTNTLIVLTNLHLAHLGDYTVNVTNAGGSTNSQVARLTVDPTFTKITTGIIVTEVGVGWGCAWGDYDNDGFIDLIVTCPWASLSPPIGRVNMLFHNNGDGTFTKITNSIVVSEARDWRGCAWADYDNDGSLDLFVTSTDAFGFAAENELFRNTGGRSFTKMTSGNAGAIVSPAAGGSEHCVWADYDNDGFLDMFVARFGPDWLLHNKGDGMYTNVATTAAGLAQENRESYGAAWGDFDNDGRLDLFVPVKDDSGLNQTNFLYHNIGNGAFTRVLGGSIATDNEFSVACAWGDYDNDGYLDLFVANGKYQAGTNALYRNNGDGTFLRMTSNTVGSIASDVASFSSCAWGDYDNDGFLDLYVTIGSGASVPSPNFFYHNNGDGTFRRILAGSPANEVGVSWNCAWGDYDNDGFLDLFVTRPRVSLVSLDPSTRTPNLLYRNNGNSNHWLTVKLVGTLSNRSAIGAKVRLRATIRGEEMWPMREINAGHGAGGASLWAHFGLGDATNINQVRIEWPSGNVQELPNIAANQILTITEPPRLIALRSSTNGPFQMQLTCWPAFDFAIETSSNLIDWTPWMSLTTTNRHTLIEDPGSTTGGQRFYRARHP